MIKKNGLIEKRNILNEIRCNNMLLQELRFFTIYLSKINAREPEKTRNVQFPLTDFIKIMGIQKANVSEVKKRAESLLQKIVSVPMPDGGWTAFQLFKECRVYKDKISDIWVFEIDAHDKALPLMFEFKRDYFTYQLWNALRLTSSNQIRMYEILKSYEKIGKRTVSIEELRGLLFIGKNEYLKFSDFRRDVLNVCQKALAENTDIKFEYELIKKARGKVTAVCFTITKNENYVDQLTLSEFIDLQKDYTVDDGVVLDGEVVVLDSEPETEPAGLNFSLFSEAFNNEFTIEQVKELYQMSVNMVRPPYKVSFETSMYDYLLLKYRQLSAQRNVKYRYNYLKKLIQVDLDADV